MIIVRPWDSELYSLIEQFSFLRIFPIEFYGNLIKSMEIHRNSWKFMELYGNSWKFMEIRGNPWK